MCEKNRSKSRRRIKIKKPKLPSFSKFKIPKNFNLNGSQFHREILKFGYFKNFKLY